MRAHGPQEADHQVRVEAGRRVGGHLLQMFGVSRQHASSLKKLHRRAARGAAGREARATASTAVLCRRRHVLQALRTGVLLPEGEADAIANPFPDGQPRHAAERERRVVVGFLPGVAEHNQRLRIEAPREQLASRLVKGVVCLDEDRRAIRFQNVFQRSLRPWREGCSAGVGQGTATAMIRIRSRVSVTISGSHWE